MRNVMGEGRRLEEIAVMAGSGYDFIEFLHADGPRDGYGKWHPIPNWGAHGWDLGDWPLIIVLVRRRVGTESRQVAYYVEGDVVVSTFTDKASTHGRIDELAHYHWSNPAMGADPPRGYDPALPAFSGPYRLDRHDEWATPTEAVS